MLRKKSKKDGKKQKGGAVTPLEILELADSYHDFWNCNRGLFEGNSRLQALLNYGLVLGIIKYIGISLPNPPPPYNPVETRPGFITAQYADYSPIVNSIFNTIISQLTPPRSPFTISDIELTTAAALNIPTPTKIFTLNDSDLANGNNDTFKEIVLAALGTSHVDADDIHILCDAGFGNMGKVGKASGKLRGIITPQVVGDSANTSLKPIGSKSNVYFAPSNEVLPNGRKIFRSDSNLFTSKSGYKVDYIDNGINDNNPYNFSLRVVTPEGTSLEAKFSPSTNTGPSAALLGGCFIYKFLQPAGLKETEAVYDQDKILENPPMLYFISNYLKQL
jgi:hypothetical protein